MATVTTPAGETLEGVEGALLDYYLGEAATVPGYVIEGAPAKDGEPAPEPSEFPKTFVGDPQPQEEIDEALASIDQPADGGEQVDLDPVDGGDKLPPFDGTEKTFPGTGEQMTAVEHPADGTMSPPVGNDAPVPAAQSAKAAKPKP